MDIVFISDLDIDTVIGIYDWEREIRQTVRLNLEMNADVRRAALTDSIEDTLDYKAVSKRLNRFRPGVRIRTGRNPGRALCRDRAG